MSETTFECPSHAQRQVASLKKLQIIILSIYFLETKNFLGHKQFVSSIFAINKKKIFTLEEANQLLPLVIKLTEESSRKVKKLINQLEAFPDKKHDKALELEEQVNKLIDLWQTKVEKLGLRPKGLWLCDFDNGAGYFCWKYPENKITFYHGYNEGFSGRKKLNYEPHLSL